MGWRELTVGTCSIVLGGGWVVAAVAAPLGFTVALRFIGTVADEQYQTKGTSTLLSNELFRIISSCKSVLVSLASGRGHFG